VRKLILIGFVQVLLVLGGCGGGGSSTLASGGGGGGGGGGGTTSGSNVVAMTVNGGPDSAEPDADTPFITITVCAPGSTTNCAQISNIEVDTGSYGLRIISSALSSTVTASLTQEYASNNQPLVECTQFVDGVSWGPVMLANVQIGGESASNVPIQVIGDSSFPDSEIPSGCLSNGSPEDSVSTFGANGIIGVGPFAQDCGSGCVLSNSGYAQDPTYYACPSGVSSPSDCEATGPELQQQVTNPVVDFTSSGDDNGVIVELPSVPDPDGAATASGSLVFGIGTESNNSLGSATVLTGDDYGDIATVYDGTTLPYSYLDTGSNAYYFDASNTSSIPDCSGSSGSSGSGFSSSWLCPTSEQTINVTNQGANSTSSSVSIKIYNADTLFDEDNGTYTAFDDLGADTGSQSTFCNQDYGVSGDCYFDLGLPFFFGRNVYVAIAGYNTSGGEGPYFAY
jgi:hypothetical protein